MDKTTYSRAAPGRSVREQLCNSSYASRSNESHLGQRWQPPTAGLIKPIVKRPTQIPMHCIREEVNPWSKSLPLTQLPVRLTSSLKTLKNMSGLVPTVSEPLVNISNLLSSADSIKCPKSNEKENQSNGSGDLCLESNPIIRLETTCSCLQRIGDGVDNVIVSVQDNFEPPDRRSLSFSSISSVDLGLADFVDESDSDCNISRTSSSASSSSNSSHYETNQDPYCLKALLTQLLDGASINPHVGLTTTSGYCCNKLLDGLGAPIGFMSQTYYGPFVGRYESIDHDDPLEVAKLATVLPQLSMPDSIANYYKELCPEIEASSLLLSHLSFDPTQCPCETSDVIS